MAKNSSSTALTFEVYRGAALLHRADFSEPSITIGRGAAALLRIEHPSLAELHAVINVEDDGSISLLDLGSEQGVSYNGERISNATLGSGDAFDLGELRIIVQHAGPEEDEDATHVASGSAGMRAASADNEDVTEETPPPAEPRATPSPAQRATPAPTHRATPSPAQRATPSPAQRSTPAPAQRATPAPAPTAAMAPEGDEGGDADDDEAYVEDVMDFILRSGTSQTNLGIDKNRPMVLEVNQVWGNTLLDTKHFAKRSTGHDVTIGAAVGWKWHFLGIDMGWVPTPLRMVLPYTPPMWSEVHSDWRNDFYAPDNDLPGGIDHVLFRHDGTEEKYTANVAASWDGFVDIEDKRYSFDELVDAGKAKKSGTGYEIPMEPGIRLMVDVNGVVFFSHMVYPGTRLLDVSSESVDYPFIAISSLVGFLGLMFGVVMYFSPKPAASEAVEIPDRFVELMLDQPEPEKKEQKKPDANPDAGEGAKAKKEEGKVGKKDAKMEKAKGNKVEVAKQQLDRQIAENAGVLGALRESGDLAGLNSGGLDESLRGGVGGLIGAKGTQIGSGGLGSRGGGLGGGGSAEGLGGLGTKGIGSGASGYGSGGGNFGAKGEGGIGTVGGDPIILGALDRALIDEVIKRHMNQIRYCYQRELTKNPALNGKIVIKFTIAKDGTVSSASTKSSTMGNAAVEQCIVGRFMRMQFPEPKGGGIVIVSYPFIFSPG